MYRWVHTTQSPGWSRSRVLRTYTYLYTCMILLPFAHFYFTLFYRKKGNILYEFKNMHFFPPNDDEATTTKKIAHKFAGGYRHFQSSVTHVANMENGFSIHMAFERLGNICGP